MLFLLLGWCFILLLSVSYGLLIYSMLQLIGFGKKSLVVPTPEILSLLGICFLAWLISICAIFIPINSTIQIALTFGAILLPIFHLTYLKEIFSGIKINFTQAWPFLVLAAVFILLLLLEASKKAIFYDTGLYHVQFIQWVQQFSIVPGLGNLHGRLAFNSHYHVLAAFFSLPALNPTPLYQSLGSYFFLLFTLFAFRQAFKHFQTKNRLLLFYLAAVVCLFIGYRPWISSPMPDSVVAIFILITLALTLERITEKNNPNTEAYPYFIFILLATLITFKLSGVYLAFVAVLLFWHQSTAQRHKLVFSGAVIFIIILLPWFVRNVFLSGYLIYPFYKLDLFNPDWKIPLNAAKLEHNEITYFARWPTSEWKNHIGATNFDWFPSWWKTQEWYDQIILILTSIMFVGQGIFFAKRNFSQNKALYMLFLIFCLNCLLWFLSAPALRFGFGYLAAASLLGLLLGLNKSLPAWLVFLAISGCYIYSLNGLKNELKRASLADILIQPQSFPVVSTKTESKNGIIFHLEPSNRCWNTPIPCVEELPEKLKMRGKTLQNGFRMVTP